MNRSIRSLLVVAAWISTTLCLGGTAGARERVLRGEVIVAAPTADVWKAWTTTEGATTFFAPEARIEPRVDGAYELYFKPEAPAGLRGSEGMRILSFEPEKRFSYTWNAPPEIPEIRGQRTQVTVELESLAPDRTRVRITHQGWGEGEAWDRAYAYFDRAWGKIVLPRLVARFANGAIDWANPPGVDAAAPSLALDLVAKR